MVKLGQIVLKGVNWVNDKIRSNSLERSQLSIHTMIKSHQIVLKRVNLVERSQWSWVHNKS